MPKEIIIKKIEAPTKSKPLINLKAKDSDDEDYMIWKKPDLPTPIVTFTPPPNDATPSSSFPFKANILTKKQLESFNVRQNNIARVFADGDDGFESLNGYNSNGSEGDKLKQETDNVPSVNPIDPKDSKTNEQNRSTQIAEELNVNVSNEPDVYINANMLKKEDEKSEDADSDGAIPTSSPNTSKRIGVRFRGSWAQDGIRESSDDDYAMKKKEKVNYLLIIYFTKKLSISIHISFELVTKF